MSVISYSISGIRCLSNMKDIDSHKLMLHLHMFIQIDRFIPNRFPTGQGRFKGPPHRHSPCHVHHSPQIMPHHNLILNATNNLSHRVLGSVCPIGTW